MFCFFSVLLISADLIVWATGEDLGYKPVRLVGGESEREGRVEVYHNGSWATICDDRWDIKDAHVVCRQLGFYEALNATVRSEVFGGGEGEILHENSDCNGDEAYLDECPHSAYGDHDCSHGEDAGVICADTGGSSVNGDADSGTETGGSHQQSQSSFWSSSSWLSWDIHEASQFGIDYDLQDDIPNRTPSPTPDDADSRASTESSDDPCLEDKCENGATCARDPDDLPEYICICDSDWTGMYCQLPVLDNDTEEEDEFDNYTEDEEIEPTEFRNSEDEFGQLKNESTTINSTITTERGTTVMVLTSVETISTTSVVTASPVGMETTRVLQTTVAISTTKVSEHSATSGDDVVTNQGEVRTTSDGRYSTQEDDHPTTNGAVTTNAPNYSEASEWRGGTSDVQDDNDVTDRGTSATTWPSFDVTDLETVTTAHIVTSTEPGQLPVVSTTSDVIIKTTTDKYSTELGNISQQGSTERPTSTLRESPSTTDGHKLTTESDRKFSTANSNKITTRKKVGINEASSTASFPVLVDGSANSSQSNTSSVDIETFVLIALGILIILLLILIAVTVVNKRRAKGNRSTDTVVESGGGTSDSIDSCKSTEYTNVTFDDCVTKTLNDADTSKGETPSKVYMPSISSSLELSPSSLAPSTSRQTTPDDMLNTSTSVPTRQSHTIEKKVACQSKPNNTTLTAALQPTRQQKPDDTLTTLTSQTTRQYIPDTHQSVTTETQPTGQPKPDGTITSQTTGQCKEDARYSDPNETQPTRQSKSDNTTLSSAPQTTRQSKPDDTTLSSAPQPTHQSDKIETHANASV